MVMNLPLDRIESGKKLLEALDKEDFRIDAAFWFRRQESSTWRLGLSPFQPSSSRSFYARIQKLMATIPENTVALEEIEIVKSDSPLLKLLRVMIRTSRGISGITLSNNTVNGVLMPDMHVYRNA